MTTRNRFTGTVREHAEWRRRRHPEKRRRGLVRGLDVQNADGDAARADSGRGRALAPVPDHGALRQVSADEDDQEKRGNHEQM